MPIVMIWSVYQNQVTSKVPWYVYITVTSTHGDLLPLYYGSLHKILILLKSVANGYLGKSS